MKKHGASHGFAVLVCTVSAALLADIIKDYVPFIYNAVHRFSSFLVSELQIPGGPRYVSILIFATALAVVWGAGFAIIHND